MPTRNFGVGKMASEFLSFRSRAYQDTGLVRISEAKTTCDEDEDEDVEMAENLESGRNEDDSEMEGSANECCEFNEESGAGRLLGSRDSGSEEGLRKERGADVQSESEETVYEIDLDQVSGLDDSGFFDGPGTDLVDGTSHSVYSVLSPFSDDEEERPDSPDVIITSIQEPIKTVMENPELEWESDLVVQEIISPQSPEAACDVREVAPPVPANLDATWELKKLPATSSPVIRFRVERKQQPNPTSSPETVSGPSSTSAGNPVYHVCLDPFISRKRTSKPKEGGRSDKGKRCPTRTRTKQCYRQPYEQWQIDILKKEFLRCRHVQKERKAIMSKMTNLTPYQIKVWFQNRRSKCKKMTVEDLPY